MIELPQTVIWLLGEIIGVLLLFLIIILVKKSRLMRRDRVAAKKLADQILQQADNRRETSRKFLQDKFGLDGKQLESAIQRIDEVERHFFHDVLQLYLKRDAEALGVLDAKVAELVETYQALAPAPAATTGDPTEVEALQLELEALKESNTRLNEELAVTKQTMSNMIQEFGNMFAGSAAHDMQNDEVVDKVTESHVQNPAPDSSPGDTTDDIAIDLEQGESGETAQPEQNRTEHAKSEDDDIDALLK